MKKNLVMVVGTCYPIASANGALALKYAEYLADEYDISIISIRKNGEKKQKKVFVNGITIYMLGRFRLDWLYKHKKLAGKSAGFKKSLLNASVFLARSCGRIDSMFFHADNMHWYKKAAYKQLERLNDERRIDSVISFCLPIESHSAAMKFKKRHEDVLWASCWADDFAVESNRKNIFYPLTAMRRSENDMLNKSDVVLSTEELAERLRLYRPCSEIYPIPYTIDSSILHKSYERKTNKYTTGVFMGNLYKTIRNPEFMLKTFAQPELKNVLLYMYIGGDCDHIAEKYAAQCPNIRVHGFIPKDRLEQVLCEADFLINIDNLNCAGKPSKLYELIGYRKPILNFGYSDYCTELKEYPNKLHISVNSDTHSAAVEIEKFLFDDTEETDIAPQLIERLYRTHTEGYVRNLIMEALNNSEKKRREHGIKNTI